MLTPQQKKLLEVLRTADGPLGATEAARQAGIKANSASSLLSRMAAMEPPMVARDEEGGWSIAARPEPEITQEGLGITDYEVFKSIGRKIGIPPDLVEVTADHVWAEGDSNLNK